MPAEIDYKALMRDALLKIDELENRVREAKKAVSEPIAIIGIGCRFPGQADTPEAYWDLLREGRCTVSEVPPGRFDIGEYYDADPEAPGRIYSRHGSFLAQVDRFDAAFFGISPREAAQMDPQQRLLLETAWEALERAGIAPGSLAASRTAVVIGMMNQDYGYRTAQDVEAIDVHTGAGTSMGAAAGRLSYFFGLLGPSFVVDTACSSSLVSVHLACRSLCTRECDLALAGGVNLILTPVNSIIESRTRILSPNGLCKTFDASADGIVRGEGCGVIALRRLSDAVAAGDPIVAVIRGSAVNHGGRAGGLSVPNGPSQEAVIRSALEVAEIRPGEVSYVEAHGTATTLGDPIEAEALGNVFGEGRAANRPLMIGSVKTNMGHLEGAAGIAGLIKVVLALQHEHIPAHLHLTAPSPLIAWDSLPLRVVSKGEAWPRGANRRMAGVSSFGFTGTNAHVVLEEAPLPAPIPERTDRPRHVLALSAQDAQGLRAQAAQFAMFARRHSNAPLADVCFTANTSRTSFTRRLAVHAASMQELAEELEAFGPVGDMVASPRIAFCFAGEAGEHAAAGSELYATHPLFRETSDRCTALFHRQFGIEPDAGSGDPLHVEARLFALEYALAALWRSWGIEPDALIGYGTGEVVAACLAGVFKLEDAVRLVARRDRKLPAGIEFRRPARCLISSVSGRRAAEDVATAGYWMRQVGETVALGGGMDALADLGIDTFLGIGPRSTLIDLGRERLPGDGRTCWSSLQRGRSDWEQMLHAVAGLYVRGASIDWAAFDRPFARRRIALPTYPFSRGRYWLEVNGTRDRGGHPLLGKPQPSAALRHGETVFASEVSSTRPAYLGDHRVFDLAVMPATAYIEMALSADPAAGVENLRILQPLPLADQPQRLNTIVRPTGPGRSEFEVHSLDAERGGWTLHTSATLVTATPPIAARWDLAALRSECPEVVNLERHYERCLAAGVEYGPRFQGVQRMWQGDHVALCEAAVPEWCSGQANSYRIHPALLDACLQVFLAAFPGDLSASVHLPVAVERIALRLPHCERLISYGRIRPYAAGAQTFLADIRLLDSDGMLVGEVTGLEVRAVPRDVLRAAVGQRREDIYYSVAWHSGPAASERALPARCLIVPGANNTAALLAEALGGHGVTAEIRSVEDVCFAINAADRPLTAICLWNGDTTGGCDGPLRLIQAAARAPRPDLLRLSFVTRGARLDPWQTPVWGLLQTLQMEHPEIRFVACDLDASQDADPVSALLEELQIDDGERRVSYRDGKRYAARLQPLDIARGKNSGPEIRADASYLITGGWGGLGLLTAEWLVRRGAHHLILLGRSAPDENARQQIDRLNASVSIVRCDVADSAALERTLANVSRPLRGVIHCAGIVEDAILLNQDRGTLDRVLSPKVQGAWNLHEHTRILPLDFFICFSSAAALLGSRGQGNYAAANTFLAALAEYRFAQGLPALTVDWGSWPNVGMTARIADGRRRSLPIPGLRTIAPDRAFATLDQLLAAGTAHAGVFAIDWTDFFEQFPHLYSAPYFAACRPAPQQRVSGFLDDLRSHRQQDWPQLLAAHVAQQAARVLGLPAAADLDHRARLFDVGLDSLMSVELRNCLAASLDLPLRSTLVFDHPTVEQLARHLMQTLAGPQQSQHGSVDLPSLEAVSHLSDDEIARLVDDELNALAHGGGL